MFSMPLVGNQSFFMENMMIIINPTQNSGVA